VLKYFIIYQWGDLEGSLIIPGYCGAGLCICNFKHDSCISMQLTMDWVKACSMLFCDTGEIVLVIDSRIFRAHSKY
jgi:hypothetical protein